MGGGAFGGGFGNNNAGGLGLNKQPATGGGLFSGATNPAPGGGLFNNSQSQNTNTGGGLLSGGQNAAQ